jgi:excisionase family DNA binding protein
MTTINEPFSEGMFMSFEETRIALGVSEATLRRMVKSGRLSFYRVGRLLKFSPDDVSEYLEERKVSRVERGNVGSLHVQGDTGIRSPGSDSGSGCFSAAS